MLYLLVFTFLLAHEELDSMECKLGSETIKIQRTSTEDYQLQLPGMKQAQTMKKPEVKDQWDNANKQMFDTYSFKLQDQKLMVRRPETKGKIKTTQAIWKDKSFDCKKL